MRKIYLSLIIIIVSVQGSVAQWSTSGNDIVNTNSGNVTIGGNPQGAKFSVYQGGTFGSNVHDNILMATFSGVGGTGNVVQNHHWLVRNSTGSDWYSVRLHDGVSIDNVFTQPQISTLTWWERDPAANIQSWGNGANTYLTINQGKVGIGTTSPQAVLDVNGTIKAAYTAGVSGSTAVGSVNVDIAAGLAGQRSRIFSAADRGYIDAVLGTSGEANFVFGSGFSGVDAMIINTANGNIGIGTASPASLFQVDDGVSKASIGDAGGSLALNWGTSYLGFNASRSSTYSWLTNGDGGNNGGGVIYSSVFGDMYFATVPTTGGSGQTLSDANVANNIAMKINHTDGAVYAKQIYVQTSGFPDYVFKKDYHLRPLSEVKSYIEQNQHLPDMPAAATVEKDGLNLGEMNKALLKKVEELTLYLIDLKTEKDKKEKEQEELIKKMEQRLSALEKQSN